MGCQTESQELIYVTMYSFIAQLLNTGFLLMLANSNLAEQGIPLLSSMMKAGPDPDFNNRWFKSVGDVMLQSQFLNIYLPLIINGGNYAKRFVVRFLDQGCLRSGAKPTKTLTLQAYIDLYSGPEFQLHLKYAQMLVLVFIALIFGVGMPLLYIFACLQLWTIYILEKGMLYYSYKKPSSYDEVLNNAVLKILQIAPMLQLSFGYWFLSNKQLLTNDNLVPKIEVTQPYDSRHYISDAMNPTTAFQPADVLQWSLFAYIVYYLAQNVESIGNFLGKLPCIRWFGDLNFDINVTENLDIYWKCLDDDDREYSILEEFNNRDKLNLTTMLEHSRKQLQSNKLGRMHLQNIHTYDILRDSAYYQAFQYFPANTPGRADLIDDGEDYDSDSELNAEYQSDLVRLVLSLAYMNDNQLHKFRFSKEYVRELYASRKQQSGWDEEVIERRDRLRSKAPGEMQHLADVHGDDDPVLATPSNSGFANQSNIFAPSINAVPDKKE